MATKFAVIRYVPDQVAGESINIGVIAMTDGKSRVQFTANWARARALSDLPTSYLRSFADDFTAKQEELFGDANAWTNDRLKEYFRKWTHAIQFSELRASLQNIDDLFPDIVSKYLVDSEPRARRKKVISKRVAANSVFNAAAVSLRERLGEKAIELVHRSSKIEGRIESHTVDVAVVNGTVYGAAFALSFAGRDASNLNRDIDALAFAAEDLLARERFPLAVSYVPPRAETTALRRAEKIFNSVGAEFLPYTKMESWATEAASKVPKRHYA